MRKLFLALVLAAVHPAVGAQDTGLDSLVQGLTGGVDGDSARVRALHDWVARHIAYDFQKFLDSHRHPPGPQEAPDPTQAPERVLASGRAVCGGYANLLKALCERAGIRAEVIDGIGRPHTNLSFAHSWNAVRIDGRWHLLDVTWAAGGVDLPNRRFVPNYDDRFFMMPADSFIVTHYPADPAWQLLPNPVTRREFEQGRFGEVGEGNFAYVDTLARYEATDSLTRKTARFGRILAFDPENNTARRNLASLQNYRQNQRMTEASDKANAAIRAYNQCVQLVNEARNRQEPRVLDEKESQVRGLLSTCRDSLNEALAIYRTVKFSDRGNEAVLQQNISNVESNLDALGEMETFLNRYFNTPAGRRKSLL